MNKAKAESVLRGYAYQAIGEFCVGRAEEEAAHAEVDEAIAALAAPAVTETDLRATIADLANRLRVCDAGRNMALEALEALAAPAVTEPDPCECGGRCHHSDAPCSLGCWAAQKPWRTEQAAATPAVTETDLRAALRTSPVPLAKWTPSGRAAHLTGDDIGFIAEHLRADALTTPAVTEPDCAGCRVFHDLGHPDHVPLVGRAAPAVTETDLRDEPRARLLRAMAEHPNARFVRVEVIDLRAALAVPAVTETDR